MDSVVQAMRAVVVLWETFDPLGRKHNNVVAGMP